MAKPENKTENCTIVNGIVLTDKAIAFILSLQIDNNGYLKEVHAKINSTISILIDGLEEMGTYRNEEILNNIKYLNSFAQNLQDLKKP